MKVLFFCPLWGLDYLPLENALLKIKEAGFDGVEMAIPDNRKEQKKLKEMLNKLKLKIIAAQFLAAGDTPKEHLEVYKNLLKEYAAFKPMFINSHTGKDFYSISSNAEFLQAASQIELQTGIPIVHETHRGRFSYSAMVTKNFLNAFPTLKLNADFSHWCNVSESYLEDQEINVGAAIERANHIHARVGHPEGPQVSDPRAPEWQYALETHLSWWDRIIERQKSLGRDVFTITPEFGPVPYLPTLPYTNQPVANQWEINCYMKDLLNARYNSNLQL